MALNLVNTVAEFLRQHPEQKFTAREIANWIYATYPDECRQKQQRSKATVIPLDSDAALLQQIVAEIGSQRPLLQRRYADIKTTEGRPRKYYFTESSDSAEVDSAEGKGTTASTVNSRALKSQYFVYFQLNHAASRLVRNELCAFIELIFSENKHFE